MEQLEFYHPLCPFSHGIAEDTGDLLPLLPPLLSCVGSAKERKIELSSCSMGDPLGPPHSGGMTGPRHKCDCYDPGSSATVLSIPGTVHSQHFLTIKFQEIWGTLPYIVQKLQV